MAGGTGEGGDEVVDFFLRLRPRGRPKGGAARVPPPIGGCREMDALPTWCREEEALSKVVMMLVCS